MLLPSMALLSPLEVLQLVHAEMANIRGCICPEAMDLGGEFVVLVCSVEGVCIMHAECGRGPHSGVSSDSLRPSTAGLAPSQTILRSCRLQMQRTSACRRRIARAGTQP